MTDNAHPPSSETSDPRIRDLATEADFEAAVALQRETWGDDFRELVPPAMLKVSQMVGGIAAGAFDQSGRLVGFVYGLTGLRDGTPAHWSHMLAVTASLRDRGIGRRLKHYQQSRLLALGVERMYWTYDPLVARNAHLNLNRLGARVVEYVPDMYGQSPHSTTDSVIGSDRFVVAWNLQEKTPRPSPVHPPGVTLTLTDSVVEALPTAPSVWLEVPEDIQALKQRDPDAARSWRMFTRRIFQHYLASGYEVRGFVRDDVAASRYILTRES